jgi:hypothetical protein
MRCSTTSARWPAECVEDGQRVEVVPPVHYLAMAEPKDRDIAVAIRSAGGDDLARAGVLEDHRSLGRVMVHGQVKAAVKDEDIAVRSVQLGDRGAALDPAGVTPATPAGTPR